ncbi:DMT family transporter [Clostridium akagii]|uniref:DMT family transporter n=1 Tax=Clostridium akagii TaxID=91623 RepID=UPI00047B2364|nr:DMT family transporter [Clostridium akagii]
MIGVILSILSGLCMSLQGVFNSRLSEKIGLLETNVFVQGTAFLLSTIILIIAGKHNFKNIKGVNKIYLLGGVLAVIIIYTVMKGISSLGTTYAISTILISQLITAGVIDAFGLFGAKKINFGTNEILGVIIMLTGIVIFKWKS